MSRRQITGIVSAAMLTLSLSHCQGSGPEGKDAGSLTMAVPKVPSEVSSVKKWTFDLFCYQKDKEDDVRGSANLIGSTSSESNGTITFSGDKVATVQTGWSCILDMSTDETVSGISDAKAGTTGGNRKVYFSSAPTKVPADRKLQIELSRKYTPADAVAYSLTVTRVPTQAGDSTALKNAGVFQTAKLSCSGIENPASGSKSTDATDVGLTFKISNKDKQSAKCKVILTYASKTYQSDEFAPASTPKVSAKEQVATTTSQGSGITVNATIKN